MPNGSYVLAGLGVDFLTGVDGVAGLVVGLATGSGLEDFLGVDSTGSFFVVGVGSLVAATLGAAFGSSSRFAGDSAALAETAGAASPFVGFASLAVASFFAMVAAGVSLLA